MRLVICIIGGDNGCMLSKFDLNLVKVLHALFEERSVTGAGHRLGRTQSAVSNSLKRLRMAFSDPLFVRSGDGLEPTPFAESLRDAVLEIVRTSEKLISERATFDPKIADLTYRIAAPDRLSLPIMRPFLAFLRDRAPLVAVDLVTSDRESAIALLNERRVDIVIGWLDRPPPNLQSELLFRSSLVGLARADHPLLRSGDTIHTEDVLEFPHLVVSSAGDQRAAFDIILSRRRLQRNIRLVVGNFGLVPSVLRDSDMIGVYTREVAKELASSGELATFELSIDPFILDHYLVWSRTNESDPAQSWLRQQIRGVASRGGAGSSQGPCQKD